MEKILPYTAIFVSALSLIGTYWFNRRLMGVQSMSYLAHLIQLERGIADIPSVLKFHGITEDNIKEADVTHEELA